MKVVIRASDLERITLNEQNSVASVMQNIMVLLNTWKGSCPLYRDFGLSHELLHKPINVAKVLLTAEIKQAVETYEPRATVLSVSFEVGAGDSSILMPTVEVEIE